jgi:AcrR family transcriptional regulator
MIHRYVSGVNRDGRLRYTGSEDAMTEYSGRGDAVRGLELLWGVRERPSRGPKPAMSLDQIVHAAIAIADAEGLEALSMRRVAEQVGFTTMALYRYVPSKAELLDVMVDTVNGERAILDGIPGGWRDKLEYSARADWALFHRHPWALQIAVHRPVAGPNGLASYESALQAVSGIGLTPGEMLEVVHSVYNFVRGAALVSVDAARAETQTGTSDEQWFAARSRFLDTVFKSGRYPTLAAIIEAGAYEASSDAASGIVGHLAAFEFGLERLLDGIEELVRSRQPLNG